MATPKTWTAHDISKDAPITITQMEDGVIRLRQDSVFLDENGKRIDELKALNAEPEDVAWENIPAAIQTAILQLREFLYKRKLEKKNMNEVE